MSKSLGNVANLLDLLEHYDPRAYRMLLLQSHYRSPVKVGQDNIDASVKSLANLDNFYARTSDCSGGTADTSLLADFRTAMDNDLDTPSAMALVFDTVRAANAAFDEGDRARCIVLRATAVEMAAALGLNFTAGDAIDDVARGKAAEIDAARAAKDFARADALRAELTAQGYVVETSKEGTRLRRG
jgi:cysteinyl-tRNA synthetase